jgi:aminoglycoside phosphotransferase (APT) family kinase protein
MDGMPVRHVVALVHDGRILLREGGLPVVVTDEDHPGCPELLGHVGADYVISPARRLKAGLFVHTVAARKPRACGDWVPLLQVPGEPAVRNAVMQSVREYEGSTPTPPQRPAWFRKGWALETQAWIDATLARCGRRRTGPVEVEQLWSLSAVLRAPTDQDAAFFKATSGIFRAEPAITRVLADSFPHVVPTVLGHDADRAWMLLDQLAGVDEDRADGAAAAAATVLADVQLRSLDHLQSLRAAGCPDRTLHPTLAGLSQLLHDSVELPNLSGQEIAAARAAVPRAAELLEELWSCGLPNTLTHGDLHLGNTAYDGAQLRLFDWTDACVSHPFLDGVHLARSALQHKSDADRRDPLDLDVVEAFAAPWRARYPHAAVDRALQLAPAIDRIFQAISYEQIHQAQEETSRWELAGVVKRFLRELPDLPAKVGRPAP